MRAAVDWLVHLVVPSCRAGAPHENKGRELHGGIPEPLLPTLTTFINQRRLRNTAIFFSTLIYLCQTNTVTVATVCLGTFFYFRPKPTRHTPPPQCMQLPDMSTCTSHIFKPNPSQLDNA
ncbi:hypothetical protein VTI28DRAFT_960 [Corynascus sepedonium]